MIVAIRRIEIPRGRALSGALVYGTLTIGISYAFLYWALVYVPASLAIIFLTLGPLLTFLFAWAHGQESFRWRGLIGALIAFTGILIGLGTEIGSTVPILPLLALVAGVILGGIATWMAQGRWRQTARRRTQDAARWQADAERLARERDDAVNAAGQSPGVAGNRSSALLLR